MRRALVGISVALTMLLACAGEGSNRATAPAATAPIDVAPPPSASATASTSPSEVAPASASSSAPASSPAPRAASCGNDLPQGDMIRDNIADTSMSGIGEIVAASRESTDGKKPAPSTGYVTNVYELHVVKWLSGSGPEKLVLRQGAEAEIRQIAPGGLLFFSACASKDGSAWEPDVGYVFPVDPACRAEAEKIGEDATKRARSLKRKPRACERPKTK